MLDRILILITLIAICLYETNAQSPYQFTVEEAVQHAITNNNELDQAKIDEEIADARVSEIKGMALPQINASGRFTDNFSLAEQQLPAEIFGGEPGTTIGVAFGNRYSVTGGVDVQQQLLNFRLFNSLKSANTLKELNQLNTLQTTENLVINVIQLYIQVQVTTKQIELLNQNYDRTDNLVNLSQQKLDEGIIKKLDLNQLIVNKTNLYTQIEDANYSRNEQLRLLKLYLNIPMESELILTEKLEDRNKYPLQNELTLNSNIQYQQLLKQKELAVMEEKLIKAEYLPSLNAFFNYNYLGNTNEFKFSGDGYAGQWNGTWGISASIPIFDGFQRKNKLQQKQLNTQKIQRQEKQTQLSIEKQYLDAIEQINLSNTQIKSQNENMTLANENYEGIKLSYNQGIAPITELLDAEFALRQAQSSYLNALLQYKVAELRVLKSSGQLSSLISQSK